MARFVKGDVVVVPFPFSDLTQVKRRPALVVTALEGDDIILCQITSQATKDQYALAMSDTDLETGALKQPSHIRPNRIFTMDRGIILYTIGRLKPDYFSRVVEQVVKIIRG